MVASIGPIRVALGSALRDALDIARPKAAAVKYSISRADESNINWAVLVVGSGLFIFGFLIYYLLPLSLLSLNLSLFVSIFFWILMALLLGLILLASNFEVTFEKAIISIMFWWERNSVSTLAKSNLVAHRERNRKTMLMYALSVAFIVFITVAANQEIRSAQFESQQRAGVSLRYVAAA